MRTSVMGSFCASLLVVGLLLPFTISAPLAVEAELDTVLTPVGLRPRENIHLFPEGGQIKHVGKEIHLVHANGTVIHVVQNDGSKVRTSTSAVVPEASGWITYASWYNSGSSPISSFTTTWNVPPVPNTDNGQTVFLFNSIEPASSAAILQPVLQYGPSAAGGGSYWAVASWYLVGSNTYFTAPIQVAVGQELDGIITLSSSSGSSYDYVTSFTNIPGTSLTATGSDQLVWATETLESYSVTASSDYPSGTTPFYNINIEVLDGTQSVTWSIVNDDADGLSTTVTTDGSINAEVVINYPS